MLSSHKKNPLFWFMHYDILYCNRSWSRVSERAQTLCRSGRLMKIGFIKPLWHPKHCSLRYFRSATSCTVGIGIPITQQPQMRNYCDTICILTHSASLVMRHHGAQCAFHTQNIHQRLFREVSIMIFECCEAERMISSEISHPM